MSTKLRLAALLAVSVIVGACGSTGGSPAPTGSSATPTPAGSTVATPAPTATGSTFPTGDVALTMWTKEGEADGALQFAKKLAADYKAMHANVTITIVNKDVEKLREDFLKATL